MESVVLGALLALGAGVAWGVGDFSGGFAAKRAPVFGVVLITHASGAVLLLVIALAFEGAPPSLVSLRWAALSALGSLVGLTSLYQGLSQGRMGTVAPVSAVITALVPVLVGNVLEGAPAPLAYAGFAFALVGVVLVSATRDKSARGGVLLGALAGLGFGFFLVTIEQASEGGLWWPLAVARGSSLVLVGLVALTFRRPVRTHARVVPLVLFAMVLDTAANALFVLATRYGRLDVAGVLSSVYPAITIALAALILKERLSWMQAAGAVCLLGAIPLIVL